MKTGVKNQHAYMEAMKVRFMVYQMNISNHDPCKECLVLCQPFYPSNKAEQHDQTNEQHDQTMFKIFYVQLACNYKTIHMRFNILYPYQVISELGFHMTPGNYIKWVSPHVSSQPGFIF